MLLLRIFRYRMNNRSILRGITIVCISLALFGHTSFCVFAEVEPLLRTRDERINYNRSVEIESNLVENWPQGPVISAKSAILMDAETGAVLYAKDIHAQEYPASTTKILTTLIVWENSSLDEIVKFSKNAIYSTPRDSNHIAMDVGDTLTMEECLNAILIRSANEVATAVAEHVGGSVEDFANRMNARAKELGCEDSHFVNANGLPDENHYTSAYDLAMIGRVFFANETLCRISMSPLLSVEKKTGTYLDANKNQLLPGKEYAYPYLVGSKTGFTDIARYSIVSCAEKNGMKLICVLMRDELPEYFQDTITLFDYGFSNFEKINISETETKYDINNAGAFHSSIDIFGSSRPILSINKNDYVILPKNASFADTKSFITYTHSSPAADPAGELIKNTSGASKNATIATINYTYNGCFIGSASVDLAVSANSSYSFDTAEAAVKSVPDAVEESDFLFINVFKILLYILGGILLAGALFLGISSFVIKRFFPNGSRLAWKMERLKRGNARRSKKPSRLRGKSRHRHKGYNNDLHF